MRLLSNGIDLGDFGSRGQVRTALLALKLAEVAWMQEAKPANGRCCCWMKSWPSWIPSAAPICKLTCCEYEQTLLTTTDLSLFDPSFVQQGTVWQVEQGMVRVPENS